MFAAILICGTMTMLTSCTANEDNPVDNNITPTGKMLTGMYAIMLEDEKGNIGDNAYNMVAVTYDFKADGTGLWSELYYNDEDSAPLPATAARQAVSSSILLMPMEMYCSPSSTLNLRRNAARSPFWTMIFILSPFTILKEATTFMDGWWMRKQPITSVQR